MRWSGSNSGVLVARSSAGSGRGGILPPALQPEATTTDDATLQRYLDEAPLHAAIGSFTVRQTDDGVEIAGALGDGAENGANTAVAHGGAISTLLDAALTFALIASDDRDWATVDLRIDFVRPVGIDAVVVRGRVVHAGRRTGRAEGEVVAPDGSLRARAVGTFVPTD
jgi:uncharacterized protein (TIGR00369 family)